MTAFYLMLPLGILFPVYESRRLKEKRLLLLAQQFKESMVILASSLSAGFSLENALAVSREELIMLYGEEGMITREFAGMVQQIRMNRAIEQVLEDFSRRSGLEDVQNFSEVFSVAKRSGGDLSGIMRHTAEVIRDKMQVKEEIRTLTASRQFEQRIMNLIPFFIVFYVEGSSPGFFDQMYGTGMGRILMTGCLITYLISFLMARRILAIEV
ncbi:type II secretion system F family protein [Clostridium sp. AN503]|uniref:type II secretion system F family protein n=1 Tax=Clostridium sp. AN503 TaxID=3160598 RepID=UPI00345A5289